MVERGLQDIVVECHSCIGDTDSRYGLLGFVLGVGDHKADRLDLCLGTVVRTNGAGQPFRKRSC